MAERWRHAWTWLCQMALLMVGVPDYEAYLARRHQAGSRQPPLSRGEFVRRCAERRLAGRGPGKCC
ncbi:CstA-like transporter-associated (seleno)protein [Paludibacterium sp. B53371]|uniref:CstA-like transporter-associated (seleno)protein n=1 Tax=Paludibacterium sp. B53371 TaxID=2806263 RepID=UPI001C05981E|nr:CstA-like transporter-associated (seleno)protein [Paludibacterium sp. B53371]